MMIGLRGNARGSAGVKEVQYLAGGWGLERADLVATEPETYPDVQCM